MRKQVLFAAMLFAIAGCAQEADNARLTVEPTMDKYKVPSNVTKFGYNNKTMADWKAAYLSCVSASGFKSDVQLDVVDFGAATTLDLDESAGVSHAQKVRVSACMHKFSANNN